MSTSPTSQVSPSIANNGDFSAERESSALNQFVTTLNRVRNIQAAISSDRSSQSPPLVMQVTVHKASQDENEEYQNDVSREASEGLMNYGNHPLKSTPPVTVEFQPDDDSALESEEREGTPASRKTLDETDAPELPQKELSASTHAAPSGSSQMQQSQPRSTSPTVSSSSSSEGQEPQLRSTSPTASGSSQTQQSQPRPASPTASSSSSTLSPSATRADPTQVVQKKADSSCSRLTFVIGAIAFLAAVFFTANQPGKE